MVLTACVPKHTSCVWGNFLIFTTDMGDLLPPLAPQAEHSHVTWTPPVGTHVGTPAKGLGMKRNRALVTGTLCLVPEVAVTAGLDPSAPGPPWRVPQCNSDIIPHCADTKKPDLLSFPESGGSPAPFTKSLSCSDSWSGH